MLEYDCARNSDAEDIHGATVDLGHPILHGLDAAEAVIGGFRRCHVEMGKKDAKRTAKKIQDGETKDSD